MERLVAPALYLGLPTAAVGLLLTALCLDQAPGCGTRLESGLLAYVSLVALHIWLVYLKRRSVLRLFVADVHKAHTLLVHSLGVFAVFANVSTAASLVAHWVGCSGKKQRWILVVDSALALGLVSLTTAVSYSVISQELLRDFRESRKCYAAALRVCSIVRLNRFDSAVPGAVLQVLQCLPTTKPPVHPALSSFFVLFVQARYSLFVRDAASLLGGDGAGGCSWGAAGPGLRRERSARVAETR